MGRRSDHARDEIYEMILSAAEEIVAESGLRGLNIRRIATKIGYSVGTIYNLFANEDDIVVQLNGRTLDGLHAALTAVPARRTTAGSVQALAAAYLAYTQAHINCWNALFEHRLPAGHDLPPWYDEKIRGLLAIVEVPMDPLFGPRRRRQRLQAARGLWCGLHGICSLASGGKLGLITDQSVADMVKAFVATYLRGLTPDSA
jgi:AcrR family transcriptional regulator